MRFHFSTTMVRSILLLLSILGLILVGYTIYGRNQMSNANASVYPNGNGATITVTDAMKIPLYPSAQNVTVEPLDQRVPWERITNFEAPANAESVLGFYEGPLSKMGWVVNNSNLYDIPPTKYRGFDWVGDTGAFSYVLTLSIRSSNLGNGRSTTILWLSRKPDAGKLPVYPGATEVKVREEPLPYKKDAILRTTTFVASASTMQIEAYYKTNMVASGWALNDDNPYPVETNPNISVIHFTYFRGNTDHPIGGTVYIVCNSESSGLVRVEIRAQGTDLMIR